MRDRLLETLGRFVTSWPRAILGVALLVTVVAAALIPGLRVLTSRAAMYPADVPVNQRFEDFLADFGTPTNLIAVLEGAPETLGPFADAFATELQAPGAQGIIRSVFYRIDMDFFRSHGFLFAPLETLEAAGTTLKRYLPSLRGLARAKDLTGLLVEVNALVEGEEDEEIARVDLASARRLLDVAGQALGELEAWMEDPTRRELGFVEPLLREAAAEVMSRRGAEVAGDGAEGAESGAEDARVQDPEGYLRSRDGRLLFLFVQPVDSSDEYEQIEALMATTRAAAGRVSERWRADGRAAPVVGLTGIPANQYDEVRAIRHDVVFTAGLAAIAVLFVIILGFRSLRRAIIAFIPLVLAATWNLAATRLSYGYLTLITSGFTAILFGLGVDYAVFITARVQEAGARGLGTVEAVREGLRSAGRTLLTAGATTSLAFFVIGFVDFKGFAELGIVAGFGVIFVIIAALVVLPAILTLVPLRVPPSAGEPAAKETSGAELAGAAPRQTRWATVSVLVVLAAFALSVGAGLVSRQVPFDGDVMNILPKDSESAHFQREMAARSDFKPEFLAVMASNVDEARALSERLSALASVARVESISDLVPGDQARKIAAVAAIVRLLEELDEPAALPAPEDVGETAGEDADLSSALADLLDKVEDAQEKAFAAGQKELVAGLEKVIGAMESISDRLEEEPALAARVHSFERALFAQLERGLAEVKGWARVDGIGLEDLPQGMRARFQGESGRFVVYAFSRASIYDLDALDRFLGEVYAISPEATGFPSTHQVFSRMVIEGFWQSSLYASLVVLFMLSLDFRRWRYIVLAMSPLLLGALWMFGGMYALGVSYNYANMVALPLIIGLAVDYGVYITHRLREDEGRQAFAVMAWAGRPVFLAAMTTLAGIGALMLGEHRGVSSLGQVLVLGIATCLTAALLVLPALATVLGRPGDKARADRPGAED